MVGLEVGLRDSKPKLWVIPQHKHTEKGCPQYMHTEKVFLLIWYKTVTCLSILE